MFNNFFSFLDPNAPNVVVTKLTLVCATAPGPLELDLTGELEGNSNPAPGQSCQEHCQQGGGAYPCQKCWRQNTVLEPQWVLYLEPSSSSVTPGCFAEV